MSQQKMTTEEWEARLDRTFLGESGIVGERTYELHEREVEYSVEMINGFKGYSRIMDSFFDFTLNTLGELSASSARTDLADLAQLIAAFRRFRASYELFWKSYDSEGASLLRGVIETMFYFGAVEKGYVPHNAMYVKREVGWSDAEFLKQRGKVVKNVERTIREYLFGEKSGLEQSHSDAIQAFINMLHLHTHRSEMSSGSLIIEAIEKGSIRIFPEVDRLRATQYVWISAYTGWMFLRVSVKRLAGSGLSSDLKNKYDVLDDSFRVMIGRHNQLIARSIEQLIEKKFTW